MASVKRLEDARTKRGLGEEGEGHNLTIEQLAAETGMSVRNIRSHQARGLLVPPEVRSRVGYYGPQHVAQLRLIRDLQEEGFNLNGIKRLLEETHGTAERLLRVRQTLAARLKGGPAETHTAIELGLRFRLEPEEGREILAKAIKMGVLIPLGGDNYEAPNPSLLAVGDEAVRSGIPLRAALAAIDDVQRHCDAASRSFVRLFLREVWRPFAKEDMPVERWPEIEDAVDRLRPAASEALMALFQERLTIQIERALNDITHRLSERKH
ncbi:MAG TPA: MerR family transcriptional regulator [Solirubrobacteraceae bacterium]|nr:MerR family transcriptional regulator [Solirubrobacteraceae bacterium]